MAQEDAEKLRASRKALHKELKGARKEVAKKIEEQRQVQGAVRKGGHRAATQK
jgi:predicted DNA-binding protein (UPF0251 family)